MADNPVLPPLLSDIEISDTELPPSPVPPLEMERPIRTDVILEDDEVLIESPEDALFTPQDIEIEVQPDVDEDGNTIVAFGEELPEDLSGDFYRNLAEEIDERELSALANDILSMYKEDRESRADWERTYSEGLSLLGMESDERSQPFQGASGVYHPLLSEAVAQFQASAYKELLPAGGPVSTRVIGRVTPERTTQAARVKEFMNYQITEVMQEYDPELDQMLFYLPLSGSSFKKIYYDEGLDRAVCKFITSEDLVVPYETTDLQSASRITHMVRQNINDVRKLQASGFYRDIELIPSEEPQTSVTEKVDELEGLQPTAYSSSDIMTILECHIDLDLSGFEDSKDDGEPTGIKLPYIVTMEEDCSQILSIRRNWEEQDSLQLKKQYFVHYKFLPGLGFYGFGLIHMIGGLSKSATSLMRQLIDAGTLANLPAGFKARGLRVRNDDEPLQPGEWRDIDAPGGALRDSLLPLPYKEPSGTLLNLLGILVDSGRRFAAITEMQTGDMTEAMPVGTTVALLEKGMQVMSAIHKRLHYSQKIEFRLLAETFSEYLPEEYPFEVAGGERIIKVGDFSAQIDVLPHSDPNVFSMAQRVMMAQTQLQLATSAPQIHDLREAYFRMYQALGIQDIKDILPVTEPENSKDPATENADALIGAPIKAFIHQDHEAHIATHMAFMQNPIFQNNQQAMLLLQSHIQEHFAMLYRQQVEQLIGRPLPGDDEQVSPELENQIAQAAAQATQQISAQAQQFAAQQGEGGIDPLLQIRMKELELKERDMQRREAEAQSRLAFDMQKEQVKTGLEETKIQQDASQAAERIAVQREKIRVQ
jgi:hypothetical protein|tara:strand:- start:4498 stop:6963 length:2466 start_codon:yes stop_codon:yes gene_type:complete